jgi:membrane peptidoglycan carboxypeptidase
VPDFTHQKGLNLARNKLLSLLGVSSLYELDRLDLVATTTLDARVQREVTEFLHGLADPERIRALGLDGERLLRANDPTRVIYSLTLYERGSGMNRLRINADNLDQPLDINSGARLDLGSTAKLRTLVSWLGLIADAWSEAAAAADLQQARAALHPRDRLSIWVYEYLAANPHATLRDTLEAAMHRRYSASTGQAFYTGGGVHRFGNFERRDNNAVLDVAEAMRRSVNLVFIRMMREIVDHYMYRAPSTTARLLENASDPGRDEYLHRFADREGTVFLRRFYNKYRGKSSDEALRTLLDGVRVTKRALIVSVRSVHPELDAEGLRPWFERHLPDDVPSVAELATLSERYAPEKFNLNDRGYLARVHPLELWLIDYLRQHPDASEAQMLAAGAEVRQEVYAWLMKTSRRRAQDRRILDLLEIEAFQELHAQWRTLGYPFASLTPSLATAIGSSGDRPAALAELMGTIVQRWCALPVACRHRACTFAAGTPYEVEHAVQPDPRPSGCCIPKSPR